MADCRHRDDPATRLPYEQIMRGLADCQFGEGRHKCPYCAYERGRDDERRRIAADLGVSVEELATLGSPSI